MRMSPPLEASISNELLPGEEVLWSGSPGSKRRSTTSQNVLFIGGVVYTMLGLVVMIFVVMLMLMYGREGDLEPSFPWFLGGPAVFLSLGIMLLIASRFTRLSPKKTCYAITNRRVIIVNGGRELRVVSLNKRAITKIQRVERSDGSGDLILFEHAGPYGNAMSNPLNTLAAIPNVRYVEQKLFMMLNEE